jgi:photosystem II stability/assembly factor-like uncharacterized protein
MKRSWSVVFVGLVVACLGAVAAPSAHAFVADGDQGWYWQTPQPADDILGVTFSGSSEVWAVGFGGTILHSTDGGATWGAQQSGTSADLLSVSFADAQHGWSCGPSAVLATTDGGSTWNDCTPAGLNRDLINVSFVDGLHGWLGSSAGYVYRTTNGGSSWSAVHVAASKDYLTVDFVNASDGWATGMMTGELWRTTNGGSSWSLVHAFGRNAVVSFVDAGHGWAAVGGNSGASVLVTSDGGHLWRPVRAFANLWVTALRGESRSSCALVGALSADSSYLPTDSDGVTTLATTSDGGSHWTVAHVGTAVTPAAIAAGGAALCAVGQGILTSADGGATWQPRSSGQLYQIQDGVAVSPSNLWAVDQSGALLHSTDGATWSEQASPLRWSQQLNAVSFLDANDGWLVGATNTTPNAAEPPSGVIFRTSDGGQSWTPQSSVLAGELTGVQFADVNNGWAISESPSAPAQVPTPR